MRFSFLLFFLLLELFFSSSLHFTSLLLLFTCFRATAVAVVVIIASLTKTAFAFYFILTSTFFFRCFVRFLSVVFSLDEKFGHLTWIFEEQANSVGDESCLAIVHSSTLKWKKSQMTRHSSPQLNRKNAKSLNGWTAREIKSKFQEACGLPNENCTLSRWTAKCFQFFWIKSA